jgi:hypothetical protein
MDRIVRQYLIAGLGCGAALLAAPLARAGQQPPPPISGVTGTIAIEGTVDQTSRAGKTVVVKTVDGVRHLFHVTDKTAVHGAESVEVEGLRGLKAGSAVVVHYTGEAGEKTALEVDRLDGAGLKTMEGVVAHVDRAGRTMTIKLADGSTQTLRLTEHAATDAGKDVERAATSTTRVVVYYADDAGQRVAHFFKRVS